jgi:hypothetical protein
MVNYMLLKLRHFLVYKPDVFEKLVQKEVDDLYDKKIYEQELEKYSGDNLDEIIEKMHDRATQALEGY